MVVFQCHSRIDIEECWIDFDYFSSFIEAVIAAPGAEDEQVIDIPVSPHTDRSSIDTDTRERIEIEEERSKAEELKKELGFVSSEEIEISEDDGESSPRAGPPAEETKKGDAEQEDLPLP